MFKKFLANTLGIGGASINAVLDEDEVVVGGTLTGRVDVQGGTEVQDIRGVALELRTRCIVEARGDEKVYSDILIAGNALKPGVIAPGASTSLPFRLQLPPSSPLTVGTTQTRLVTRLDVAGGVDPSDTDGVAILPNRAMSAVFQGMEEAGFRLVETEVEYNPRRSNPFVQEFDFQPRSSRDYGIEEVEISFSPTSGGPGAVEVLLTVDNRGGFFSMGGERGTRFRLTEAEASRIDMAAEIRRIIAGLRR